jgi:hypothetical protein
MLILDRNMIILIYMIDFEGGVRSEKNLSAKEKTKKERAWIQKKNEYKSRKKCFKET